MEQNEKRFMDLVNKGKVLETFGCGKLADIAYRILERVPDETRKEDAVEAILRALDDELIYRSDEWEVIEYYSSPENPISLSEAYEPFLGDLIRCID